MADETMLSCRPAPSYDRNPVSYSPGSRRDGEDIGVSATRETGFKVLTVVRESAHQPISAFGRVDEEQRVAVVRRLDAEVGADRSPAPGCCETICGRGLGHRRWMMRAVIGRPMRSRKDDPVGSVGRVGGVSAGRCGEARAARREGRGVGMSWSSPVSSWRARLGVWHFVGPVGPTMPMIGLRAGAIVATGDTPSQARALGP